MILLIPNKKYPIKTKLSIEEAVNLVSEISFTEPLPLFRRLTWSVPYKKIYEGRVFADGFRIQGPISSRTSTYLEPFLDGRFVPTANGVQVEIHWRLHPIVIAFMSSLLLGIGFVLLAVIYNWIMTGEFYNERYCLLLDTLIFFYIATYTAANISGHASEKIMIGLFKEKQT